MCSAEKLSELALAVQICLVGLENTGMNTNPTACIFYCKFTILLTPQSLVVNESSHHVDLCVLDAADCLAAAVLKANDIGTSCVHNTRIRKME